MAVHRQPSSLFADQAIHPQRLDWPPANKYKGIHWCNAPRSRSMNAIDPLGALLLTVAVAELQLHRLDLIETLRKLGHLQ